MKISKNNKKKGFTFMELVITMIIVITLSLISWPIYRGHVSKEYSVLAEGYALLGAIKDAEIAYYNEYGNFLHQKDSYGNDCYSNTGLSTFCDPVLGINAINNRYFTLFNAHNPNGVNHDGEYAYQFRAAVYSAKAGTITQLFDITKRYDPVVTNMNTDLSF